MKRNSKQNSGSNEIIYNHSTSQLRVRTKIYSNYNITLQHNQLTHFFNQYSSFSLYLSHRYCLIVSSNCWHKGLTTYHFLNQKILANQKLIVSNLGNTLFLRHLIDFFCCDKKYYCPDLYLCLCTHRNLTNKFKSKSRKASNANKTLTKRKSQEKYSQNVFEVKLVTTIRHGKTLFDNFKHPHYKTNYLVVF